MLKRRKERDESSRQLRNWLGRLPRGQDEVAVPAELEAHQLLEAAVPNERRNSLTPPFRYPECYVPAVPEADGIMLSELALCLCSIDSMMALDLSTRCTPARIQQPLLDGNIDRVNGVREGRARFNCTVSYVNEMSSNHW